MKKINVSVIIPTYNRALYLAEAVRSVLQQTCPAFEIIIIDNGSDVQHQSELSSIESSDSSIKLLRLQSNKGAGYARNIGISEAAGDWLLFLDDDDILAPDYLEQCCSSIESEDSAEIVFCRALSFKKGQTCSYPRDAVGAVNLWMFKKDPVTSLIVNGIAVSSCIIRKTVIGQLRFEEGIWHGEDTLFWYSLMQGIKYPVIASGAYVGIREHPGKLTLANHELNPDGSPVLSRETYIQLMINLTQEKSCWRVYVLRIVLRRIADNSWHTWSILLLLLSKPVYGISIINILLFKRLYRYAFAILLGMNKKNRPDLTWLPN